ncbi:hypothetical protein HanXRQr2_Chr09g0363061 [Helianthus annuus]|uniref:Uncharacterized protein n=1 Tax=Helianthus annuus TaxID=4232 RepID=A0A251TRV7_HELAN|nr:hypothetical protein HanXRQr2_Chr09g0363061 [Helianthus annuus]KAJ0532005.1 hypothetical protein HanIR_Chr09g0391911 [Helianthus annuus]
MVVVWCYDFPMEALDPGRHCRRKSQRHPRDDRPHPTRLYSLPHISYSSLV